MKRKEYMKPTIMVVPVKMSQMLCGSPNSFTIDSNDANAINDEEDVW